MHVAQKVVQDSQYKNLVGRHCFCAANRLLRKDRYDQVIRADQVDGKLYKIFYKRNESDTSRLGIIATKRNFPRSVDRNRLKRFVRETFRQHNIKVSGLDLVVMVKRPCLAVSGDTKTEALKSLFFLVENKCV